MEAVKLRNLAPDEQVRRCVVLDGVIERASEREELSRAGPVVRDGHAVAAEFH
jgi:hypothetical protein